MSAPEDGSIAIGESQSSGLDRSEARRLERSTLFQAFAPLVNDLSSTLAFYALFAITHDPRLASAVGIAVAILQVFLAKVRQVPIAPLQWASIGLVLVLGSLTILTSDPRFVIVKVTLVYAVIGGTMLQRGWMARYIPNIAAAHLPDRLLYGFEKSWAALLLGTGALNLYVVLTGQAEQAAGFLAVWVVASKLALFAIQYLWCRAVARPAIKASLERNL